MTRLTPTLTDSPVLLVGENSSALAQTLQGRNVPVDTVPYPRGEAACAALVPRLRARSVRRVLVILPRRLTGWECAAPLQVVLQNLSDIVPQADGQLTWLCVGQTENGAVVPEHAAARGVLLSVRREEARFRAGFVECMDADCSGNEVVASALADGLLRLDTATPAEAERMSWLRLDVAGKFFRPDLSAPLETSGPLPALPPDACMVITGGLGDMALCLAGQLTPQLGTRLALLHRSPFPAAAAWDKAEGRTRERILALRALRRHGVDFRLYQCDVTDETGLSATLERVRRECGPIMTVIHTAGIAGDGFLLHKTRTAFEAVVAPKLDGVRLLHTLTLGDPIRFFILASSRTALAGAAGQSDYAAANAALDSFAHWRAQQGLPALSLAWNTWAEIGMAARAGKANGEGTPFMLFPDTAGAALLHALASGATYVTLSMTGESLSAEPEQSELPKQAAATHPELPAVAAGLSGYTVPDAVRVVVERVLGYEDKLTPDDDFYALGGDSLSGTRIVTALGALYGISLGLADLLANSRIAAFAARVAELLETAHPAVSATPELPDYPVSREQLAVLRAVALAEPHTGYNLPQFLPLPADCTPDSLRGALQTLTQRHDILRTRFIRLDQPEPRMVIQDNVPVNVSEYTFATLEDAAAALVRPFDLSESLFRAAMLHIAMLPDHSDMNAVLFFDIHHAVADAKGVGLLLRDLSALLAGKTLPLAGLQQKDAAWRQHEEAPEALQLARAYWLAQYADGLPHTDLEADFARPAWHSGRGANAMFSLPASRVQALKTLASTQNTTLSSLLFAVWAMLLHLDAHTNDVVIALAADNRGGDFADTAGMFACVLPVRVRVEPEQPLRTLLRAVQQATTDALRHSAFPLGNLLAELKPPVDLSRTLLAEVTFSFMNYGVRDTEKAPYTVPGGGCKADLAIFISELPDGLLIALEYYADLFAPARMHALGQRFSALTAALVASGGQGTVAEILACSGMQSKPAQPPNPPAAPLPNAARHDAALHPDLSALEAIAAETYQTFFDVDALTPEDDFFTLGGHSLLAMQIVNALNKRCRCTLTIRDLFANPEPRNLAAQISRQLATQRTVPDKELEVPASTPAGPALGGRIPLSHAQQRLYVLHRMEANSAYSMIFVFILAQPLDHTRLSAALHALARRQEILRTTIHEQDGSLWQQVTETMPPCRFHPEILPEPEACQVAVREALEPFDPAQPMLRLCVVPTSDGGQCMALGMHHIIGDGWSMQIFFGELMALYTNPQAVLPPLPLQYRDYALAQQHRDWSEAADYWRGVLRDLPGRIVLPADAPAGKEPHTASTVTRMVAPATLEKLRAFAVARRMPLTSCLLSLFAALLFRLSRRDDLLIGMGVAGREQAELEGLIGFFVNILPIRVRMPVGGSLDELLDTVNAACREALARQAYPFDLLVRECAPRTGGQREEQLVNVMFEYQRYSDVRGINTVDQSIPHRIVDAEDWMPLVGNPPPARYDLTLYVQDEPQGCRLRAEYDSGLFTGKTVSQWLAFLEILMENAAAGE